MLRFGPAIRMMPKGRRKAPARPAAMSKASRVRSSVMRVLIAQPTAKREWRSRITAR